MNSKIILITGNLGYVGVELVKFLKKKNKKLFIIGYDIGFYSKNFFQKIDNKKYIDQIITEADLEKNNKVSYQEFLAMWKNELVERQIEGLSGINNKRTVSVIADMLDESDDEGRRGFESEKIMSMRNV